MNEPVGDITVSEVTHNDDDTTTIQGVDEAGFLWKFTVPNGTLMNRRVHSPKLN